MDRFPHMGRKAILFHLGGQPMGNSFRGWYFKCQSPTQTLALIPAIHTCRGRRTSSIQIVTEHEHWNISLPGEGCLVRWDRPQAKLGQNYSPQGVELHLHSQHCHVEGQLRSGSLPRFPAILWAPSALFPFWSVGTGSLACGIQSQAGSVSTEGPIALTTIWDISRGTKAALSLAATSGPSAYFRKVP